MPGKRQQSFGGNGAVGRRIPESELVEKGALMAASAASAATRAGKRPAASALGRQVPTTSIPSLKSLGKRPPVAVAKRGRSYDPESRRQRRLGAEVAGGVIGGGLLATRGVRNVARDTKQLRTAGKGLRGAMSGHNQLNERLKNESGAIVHDKLRPFTGAERRAATASQHMVSRPSRRQLLQILGGSGIAGGSVAAGHRASRDSNDRWY